MALALNNWYAIKQRHHHNHLSLSLSPYIYISLSIHIYLSDTIGGRRRLRRWHSDTGKYTQPSRNTTEPPQAYLHVNAHKTEYMCYNQTGDISTLDGTPLKLMDKFTYLGSSVSSTEKDIDTRLTKAWTAIDRLSII